MFCSRCGSKIENGSNFCNICGNVVNGNVYYNQTVEDKNKETSLIMGIIALVGKLFLPFFNIVFAIIAIYYGNLYKKQTGLNCSGKVMGIVSLALSGLFLVVLLILIILPFIFYGAAYM